MTVEDVVNWLQSGGYQAKVVTGKNGKQTITSSVGGTNFHVGFYDCNGARCGSIQFFAGFDTKGALNPVKMNQWDRAQRWGRAYVDNVNDPWLEMDVDLTPGGTYELLNDEFATWRALLARFRQFIGV
ncbi:MAG: YbjN domain-containing protein [Stellaceae bacterium]